MDLIEVEKYLSSSLVLLSIDSRSPREFKQLIVDLHKRLIADREEKAKKAKPGPELSVEFSTAKYSELVEAIKVNGPAIEKVATELGTSTPEPAREVEPESPCVVTMNGTILNSRVYPTIWEAKTSDGRTIVGTPLGSSCGTEWAGLAHKLADGRWVFQVSKS